MQSPEFYMKANQTRREGQRQESTPGREANVKTGPPARNEVEHKVDKNNVIFPE